MKIKAKVVQEIRKEFDGKVSYTIAVLIERDDPREGFDIVTGRVNQENYILPQDKNIRPPFNCIASVGFGKQKVGADGWADKFRLEHVDAGNAGK